MQSVLSLVGRREELALLEAELTRASAGELRVVVVLGEAGVGKSRLVRELAAHHPEARTLAVRAHRFAASAAFGVWTEAVDPFLRSLSDAEVVELCGGALEDLASVLLRVAVVRGAVPDRDPPLPRLLQGLAHVLRGISNQAPLLVVLDDVHFADASSWEALRYFSRHLDDAPILIAATSRPAELAAHDLATQVLFELEEDGLLSRVELAPLDRTGIRELTETIIEQPEITDEVTVLDEPCPCGSAHRCVADIQGRLDDTFVYEGRPVHPLAFHTALGRRAGIVEYQVRQTPDGAHVAVRCQAPVDLDELARDIGSNLARLGLEQPSVTLEAVDRLERTSGPGKLTRFVPLLEAEAAYASAGSSSSTSLRLG